jgi:phosphopantetheinyl transferase
MIHGESQTITDLKRPMMLDLYTMDTRFPLNAALRNQRPGKSAGHDLAARRQNRSALGRVLLRTALAHRTGTASHEWQIEKSASGRPTIRLAPKGSRDLHISLAHSGSLLVAAIIDNGAVGIDIESISTRSCREIARYLNWPTSTWARPDDRRFSGFFHMWTLWESLIKSLPSGQPPNALFNQLVSQLAPGTPASVMSNGWFAASWRFGNRFWLSTTAPVARRPNLQIFALAGLTDAETPRIDEISHRQSRLDSELIPSAIEYNPS